MVAIIAYIIGSFSSSYVLGRVLKKADIRDYGSGNAGATNAVRVFGKKIGVLAFILDVLKGVLAVYIGNRLLGYDGKLIAGFFAVAGHNWPVFLKFKGGKGIATSFGILLSIHWPTAVSILMVFIAVAVISRYISLSSIASAIVAPVAVFIVKKPFDMKFFIMTLLLAILAIYRHRENIKRLMEGKEYRIGEKVKRG
ncbi:MAG TPA: glycerol-3-phosphate 1-O-acyltransferase PlsY [Tissierellia bacterium]|nr:glycerol-3-phosphate 1-O-acyltransferase PlsY [Tissierellia bacterium]